MPISAAFLFEKRRASVDGKEMAYMDVGEGAILTGPQLEFCRSRPNQTEVAVAGNHFMQEDSPDEIGLAVAKWITSSIR